MIIFLDFDGVLHPANANADDFFCRRELFESAISTQPKVQIVISSTWREVMSLPDLKAFFSEKIRNKILGVTPTLDDEISAYWRYEEIRLWIKRNQYAGNWLAIDDAVQEFPPACPQLIACDAQRGFDASVANELSKALSRMDGQTQSHQAVYAGKKEVGQGEPSDAGPFQSKFEASDFLPVSHDQNCAPIRHPVLPRLRWGIA